MKPIAAVTIPAIAIPSPSYFLAIVIIPSTIAATARTKLNQERQQHTKYKIPHTREAIATPILPPLTVSVVGLEE